MREEEQLREYLTPTQLEECLEIQLRNSSTKSLLIIAIEQGHINAKSLAKIVKKLSPENQQPKSSKKAGKKFGELCIEKGFASHAQIEECLEIQARIKREGKHFRLGQILIEKKYVAVRQAQMVLELQGKKILRCQPCDTKYNIRNYRQEKNYQCPKCNSKLVASSPISLSTEGSDKKFGVENSINENETIDITDESISLINRKINDYEIVELLGEGGMADVYKVVNPFRKRPRALKMMKASAGIERFNREFDSAHALRHPHIVRVYETGKFEARPYFFMELLEGGSLENRLEKYGLLAFEEALTFLKQITIALKYAHAMSIVHRDIKPSNVLITRKGKGSSKFIAKITDFGIARKSSDSKITVTGHLVGTFKYMAPEHIKGQGVDGKNDIFSLGVMAYEMFAGQEPFKVDDPIGYLFVNIKETPPPLHELNPDLPCSKPLSDILKRMMAKNPNQRYDAAALLRDIDRLQKYYQSGEKLELRHDEDNSSVFYQKKRLTAMFTWVAQKLSGVKDEEVPIIIEEDTKDKRTSKREVEVEIDNPDLDNMAATEEIGRDDVAKQHYEQAMSLAQKGDLRGASKSFQNLMHTFPGSPYSRKAKKKLKLIELKLSSKEKDPKSQTSRSQKKKSL